MLSIIIVNELSEINIIYFEFRIFYFYFIFIQLYHTPLHNLNINFNLILFTDDTSVNISKPSNIIICKRLNLVILNV